MATKRPATEPRRISSRARGGAGDFLLLNNWVGASAGRPAKKDNPEREREATLSRDSTPGGSSRERRTHTPHSYPRTKQVAHMRALERLRQTLQFNDETSGTENEEGLDFDTQSQDSGVQDPTPDSNQIVGRLMQIRDYLKQATSIMESLDKDSPASHDQFGRINKLIQHLKEQEEGYLALLQKMLADRSPGSEVLNNQRDMTASRAITAVLSNGAAAEYNTQYEEGGDNSQYDEGDNPSEKDDDEVSIDVETASEVSINTDRTWNAYTRPNIESHMGFHSDMSSVPNSASGSTSSGKSRQSKTLTAALSDSQSSLNLTLTNGDYDDMTNQAARVREAMRKTQSPTEHVSSSVGRGARRGVGGSGGRGVGRATHKVQSNVDLYKEDEVDGSYHHITSPVPFKHTNSNQRNGRSLSNISQRSPRLKQTNLPIMSVTNQPFDELIGVEFAEEDVRSSDTQEVISSGSQSEGFDMLTQSGGDSERASHDGEGEQSDKAAEVEALREQRDLLKKMLDQQRMLKALHERQADLLELQRKTDSGEVEQAAAASPLSNGDLKVSNISRRTVQNGRDFTTQNGGRDFTTQNGRSYDEDKDRNEQESEEEDEDEEDEDSPSESETEDQDELSVEDGAYAEPPPTRADDVSESEPEVPAELKALRDRLLHLKNIFDENLTQQMDDQRKLDTLRQMQSAAPAVQLLQSDEVETLPETGDSETSSNPERRQLRNKLSELQEKKEKMEQLLGELQTLRDYRRQNVADDVGSESTVTGHVIRDRQEMTDSAGVTAGQAETVLDVMEQESKLRKLEEVRGRLDQLRDLVQYYQAGNEFIHSDTAAEDNDDTEGGFNLMSGLTQTSQRFTQSVSESEPGDDEDLSLNGNLRLSAAARHVQTQIAGSSVSGDMSDVDSSISLGEFGNDPEIQEKVRKLQSARERLARLQSLVSMVQQWPESAEVLPEDLAELAASAMDDTASECSTYSKASTTSAAQSFSDLYEQSRRSQEQTSRAREQQPSLRQSNQRSGRAQGANKNASNAVRVEESDTQSLAATDTDSRAESEAFYLQRMEEQKLELSKLMEEREKLMKVQEELKSLHTKYTDSAPEAIQGLLRGAVDNVAMRAAKQSSKAGSSRAAVTFSAKLPDEVDSDPANDELYTRMMEQKMKRQENPRKNTKGDEDQLTADVTTLATWGDSETTSDPSDSDESADSDDSENTPADEREIDEQDDGYPSDGIVQVEEEEEANDDSDRDTYTVEDDYELRQRYPVNVRSRSSRQRPHTHAIREAGNPAAGDYWESKQIPALTSASKSRSPVEVRSGVTVTAPHGSGTDMIAKMKDQLDATTDMCQHLLREQRKLNLQIDGEYGGGEPWQENRVIYSINQLFSQVMDMQAALQVTVDQVYAITQHLDNNESAGLELSSATLRPDTASAASRIAAAGVPVSGARSGLPAWARPNTGYTPRPESRQAPYPGLRSYDPLYHTKASQAGGDAATTTDQSQSEGDRTPTNHRQAANISLQQVLSGRSNATSEYDSKTESARQHHYMVGSTAEHNYSIPPLDLDKLIKRRQEQSRSLQSSGRSYPSPSLSAIAAGRVHVPLDTMYKPGISAGIAGTSYADNTSVSTSAVSSVRGGSSTGRRSSNEPELDTPSKVLRQAAENLSSAAQRFAAESTSISAQNMRDRTDKESATSDYSLFEALRETIYSEVATLISQNENRPHFLIELFRELQMLSSDYLRQRGLYSIQELVTKFLTEDVASLKLDTDSDGDILAPQPAWMLYRTTGSEQTPSESCVTTDEEEVRQMLSTQHSMTPVSSQAQLAGLQRVGSIKSDFADYIEQVETTSTLSTSHSQRSGSAMDDPFNQDSLGDTVIHLEQAARNPHHRGNHGQVMTSLPVPSSTSLASTTIQYGSESGASDLSHDFPFACDSPLGDTAIDLQEAMQKVKDIDRRKAAKRDTRSSQSPAGGGAVGSAASEGSSSSAQDAGSDVDDQSTDMQMTRIDTQQLDRQIKQIMTEIIPVLREHMENVCSSQLLEYIQLRVIELTIQTDSEKSKPERTVEFAQFFQKQLSNILRDSLAKFEGRKMRECGEEVLVDISEILFNELAFFKLMQDLDDPQVKDKLAQNKWRSMGRGESQTESQAESDADTSTADPEAGDEEIEVISEADPDNDSTEGEEESDDEEEELREKGETSLSQTEEVENLGNDRDDAFADEVNTRDESCSITSYQDIHFELAPSETKPMTRIGSDEDFSDDEDNTSELSTDDGDDTAISRQTAQDQEPASLNDGSEADDEAVGINDLPSKLNVDMNAIEAQAAEEQKMNQSAAAELVDLENHELAGSGTELKPPPSSSAVVATPTEASSEPAEVEIDEKRDDNTEKSTSSSPGSTASPEKPTTPADTPTADTTTADTTTADTPTADTPSKEPTNDTAV